jgi:ribosome maturation factor RimP
MERSDVEIALAGLAVPFLEHKGLYLWGVEYFAGAGRSLVRVFIDGPDGVDVEACAKVSRHLGVALEVDDLIRGPFTLEVSSPGLTRTFFWPNQLADYLGRTIEVSLREPKDGRKRFTGVLTGVEEETFGLDVDGADLRFDWKDIKRAKLVHDFSPHTELDKGRAKAAPPRTGGKK